MQIKANDWIREQLTQENFDTKKVYSKFEEFKKAFPESRYDRSSFDSQVRKIKNKFATITPANTDPLFQKLKNSAVTNLEQLYKLIDTADSLKKTYGKEWASLLYTFAGAKFSADRLRDIFELISKTDMSFDDIKNSLKIKSENIHLKDEVNTLKREVKSLHKESYSNQTLMDSITDVSTQIELPSATFQVNINKIDSAEKMNNIVLFSDLHYMETVEPAQMNGLNEYTCEIARERVDRLFVRNLEWAMSNNANKLYLQLLGDLISGNIHDELKETNEGNIMSKVIELATFLSSRIEGMKPHYDYIQVDCVPGNHSRLSKEPRYKNKVQETYEYLIFKMIEEKFKGDAIVKINVSEAPVIFAKIGDLNWKIEHGDNTKSFGNFLGIPVQGLARDVMRDVGWAGKIGEDFTIASFGHFHVPSITLDSSERLIIVNGSIIGPNEYSINKLHSGVSPTQYAFIQGKSRIKYVFPIPLKH